MSESLSALSGYLVGVGDVNADGKSDLLARWSSGDNGSLRYGGSLSTHRATFNGVKDAAAAPYIAAADINSDGSSDMAFVPSDAAASSGGYGLLSFQATPFVAPADLSVAADPLLDGTQVAESGVSLAGAKLMAALPVM